MSKKNSSQLGLSPGSLVYVGPEVLHDTEIKLFTYSENNITEKSIEVLHECNIFLTSNDIKWLDIDGIHEQMVIETIGQTHHIHALVLEDIMNTHQKPKLDFYNDTYLFVCIKMLHFSVSKENEITIIPEHISFILGNDYLISFQEQRTVDIFEPIIERLKESVGKTRKNGSDYLLFSLIDLVVDNYLVILEKLDDQLDKLEEQILKESITKDPILELFNLKRELTQMRKYVWPLKAMLNELMMEESKLISATSIPYFKDVQDHVNQVVDAIDAHKELLTGLMDIHYSTLSKRMNTVMKTLTVFSAIFMPLTFIVGIYGMNFNNMPELRHPNGYFIVVGVMVSLAVGLLIYFRKKGWL